MKRSWTWEKRPDLLRQIETLLVDHSWAAIAYIISEQEKVPISLEGIRDLHRHRHFVKMPENRAVKFGIREVRGYNVQSNSVEIQQHKGEKTEFEEERDGNHAVLVKYTEFRPKTLEEMLEVCNVDTEIWKVDRYVINSWDVTMKSKSKDLDSVITHPNFQIKCWLIRRVPIKHEWPVIQPVTVKKLVNRPTPRRRDSIYKALIIPDSQNGFRRHDRTGYLDPFHDRRAWDIVLQVAEMLRPDVSVFLGDQLDLPVWTEKFLRSPDMYFCTQPALEELHVLLRQVSEKSAETHYLCGNHEVRLEKSVIANTMEAYGLKPAHHPDAPPAMSIENLLSLEEIGIQFHGPYPYGEYWINDNLRCSHGEIVRKGNSDSVKAVLQDARNSEIFGHTHRAEMAYKTVHPHKGPITYMAVSCGTIARIDNVVPAGTSRHDWQQAFAVVDFTANGYYHVNLYSINDGRTVFDGKLIEHRDMERMAKGLSDATGWDYTRKDA